MFVLYLVLELRLKELSQSVVNEIVYLNRSRYNLSKQLLATCCDQLPGLDALGGLPHDLSAHIRDDPFTFPKRVHTTTILTR